MTLQDDGKSSERTHGVDKIGKYKWADPGDPGELMWIPKGDIEIDDRYQREADNKKANLLAAEFDWTCFGVLIVGRRESGKFFCAEGQHRLLAAMKRSDIVKVPCFVFRSKGAKAEAAVFVGANCNRKPVPAYAKYKALLMCGDEMAVAVRKLVDANGRRVEQYSQAGTVSCVALLVKLMSAHRVELERVFPIASAMCEGEGIPNHLIDALVYIEVHLPAGASLCQQPWRKRVEQMAPAAAFRAMASAAAFHARGGAKVWASGLLAQINKHARNRLALEGSEPG
jgi:hypothetical protein